MTIMDNMAFMTIMDMATFKENLTLKGRDH